MTDYRLSEAVGLLYEVSASDGDWHLVGRRLFDLIGVDSGSLRLPSFHGQLANMLQPALPEEVEYLQKAPPRHDPIGMLSAGVSDFGDWSSAVRFDEQLAPRAQFERTTFYNEFARPMGRTNLLLGKVRDAGRSQIMFFRDGRSFGEDERETLVRIMPHLQRAVQLRGRLQHAELNTSLGHAAFDALSGGAVVVDAELRVLSVNISAERSMATPGFPVATRRSASGNVPGRRHLLLRDQRQTRKLSALVEDAAAGGSGGAIRLEYDLGRDDRADQLALLISPQPLQFRPTGGGLNTVLILFKELSRPATPPISLLIDLFGLSAAEGAVAAALLAGHTAEAVARERDVSLDTVRSQIRTLLRKSEAVNLRDFQRMGTVLSAMLR